MGGSEILKYSVAQHVLEFRIAPAIQSTSHLGKADLHFTQSTSQ